MLIDPTVHSLCCVVASQLQFVLYVKESNRIPPFGSLLVDSRFQLVDSGFHEEVDFKISCSGFPISGSRFRILSSGIQGF